MSYTDGADLGAGPLAPDVPSLVKQRFLDAGYSPAAAAGIAYNINAESGFNPTLRHPDQPHFGGEAHYAHGLYQEGGDEWNNYSRFLQGRQNADWRDPINQTDFVISRLNHPDYAHVNAALRDPNVTPQSAATAFMGGYLRPAAQYAASRQRDINRWDGSDNYASTASSPNRSPATAQPTMSNSYLADAMGGGTPVDQGPLLNAMRVMGGQPQGGGMSPLERAGIYLMSISNPSALSGLASGSRDAEQRNQMMLRLMGMQQSKNQFQQQELRRRLAQVADPSGDVNALTGKPLTTQQYRLEGLTDPYEGLDTLARPSGAQAAPGYPTGPQGGVGPSPQIGAQGGYGAQGEGAAAQAPQATPGPAGPSAASAAGVAPPPPRLGPQPVSQTPATGDALDGMPFLTTGMDRMTLGDYARSANGIANYVGVGDKRDPNKVAAILQQLDETNPAASAYFRGVMGGESDPTFQRQDALKTLYSGLNAWLPALTGKDAAAWHKEYEKAQKFDAEDMNANKAGSIGAKLQALNTYSTQGLDLNQRYSELHNTNGPQWMPNFLQEGVGADITWPFHMSIGTPNQNSHIFGEGSDKAKAFDRYAAGLGREVNKFLTQGSGNGAEGEREYFGTQLSSTNKPNTHFEQMGVMDEEARRSLEAMRKSVESQFGKDSPFYQKWLGSAYSSALQDINKVEADTHARYAPGSGSYYKSHPEAAYGPSQGALGTLGDIATHRWWHLPGVQ